MFIHAKPGATRLKHVTTFSARPAPQLKLREMLGELPTSEITARRARIFDLNTNLHCSIIGTCLTMGETRHVLVKLEVEGARTATDHEIHAQGVQLAARNDAGGKLLNKALDKKHRGFIARFGKVNKAVEVFDLWRQSVREGDIPGAYWAALTHPAATDEIIRQIFGELHMLSHLVGAANRADIRRLTELEAENQELKEKVARQQTSLRDAVVTRDKVIKELQRALADRQDNACSKKVSDEPVTEVVVPDGQIVMAEFSARLGALARRGERLQERLDRARSERDEATKMRDAASAREKSLLSEIDALEWRLSLSEADYDSAESDCAALDMCILYVGGFTHQITQLRSAAEKIGLTFLHHDGGLDERSGLIASLISRADLVVFPVDCISHVAVTSIKKSCRQFGKRFRPLRSSSRASFLAALRSEAGGPGSPVADARAIEASP